MMPGIPQPRITQLTKPFWDAARERRLILPHCDACGRHFFRPEIACRHCGSRDWQWVEASGKGTLYSYSIIHRAPTPAFRTPFVFAVVELAEEVAMFSNIVGCRPEDVRIGMTLQATFEAIDDELTLPLFEPA